MMAATLISGLFGENRFMRIKTYNLTIVLVLIVGIRLISRSTVLIETIYANSIYKAIIPPLSRLTGIFPFSLAEILIGLLVLWLLFELIHGLMRRSRKQAKGILSSFTTFITVVGLLYLMFMGLWGLNYYRLSFAEMAGLDTSQIAIEELKHLGQSLVDQANQLRDEVEEDNDGVMRLENRPEVFDQAVAGYDLLADRYPRLEGQYGRAKGLLFSPLISYTGMYGFYIPFTGEANVNTRVPDAMIPFSACHEMAHQRGIAREGEANFVGYLSCIANPHHDFQYSGTLLALTYVLNDISGKDQELFADLRDSLSPGVIRDLQEIREFGEKHRGLWSRISSRINDIYLKANSQSSGNRSYSGIVELLVALHRMPPVK